LSDGNTVSSNMYMWQPVAGSFYAPCVDGSFDMSVIGHEYGHAISNRMAGGPTMGLSGLQAGAMGESWSDLMAMEYLQENGYVPVGGTATPMGAYVTGNPVAGIRNYNMGQSPLNYSNVGYDLTGPQVHADGEIWSATNNDVRTAFIDRYGVGDAAVQKACADGDRAADQCPGNRRWIQLVFDAWLLMPSGQVSMVDARDRMIAADLLRFGGANQDLLWDAFAARGLGQGATSTSSSDPRPVPSFASPSSDNATLRFSPTDEDGRPVVGAKLFVGDYSGRSRPVADTDPATGLPDTFSIVPGEVRYTATAPGHGHAEASLAARPGQVRDLPVPMRENLASSARGAIISGSGANLGRMVDDDEGTTATTVDQPTDTEKVFTIDLAGGRDVVRRVQVSALPEPGVVGRFQALRQFAVLACDAKGQVDCTQDADYRLVYTSPADAFPAGVPRPTAPTLNMRSFEVPQVAATHLRLSVLANQCQGGPAYQGEQDADPANATDCDENYAGARKVGITEVQVFRR
ncbi:MAG TPA: M36 family metallopeptidase, partial [Ornithinibacter sp.]|nr:M36 family metallopeptidase [Ornithinibacter sp.]